MQKYEDWKHKGSSSAILEALNRGSGNSVSNFGSVNSFIEGILGPSFGRNPDDEQKKPEPLQNTNNQKIEDIPQIKSDSIPNFQNQDTNEFDEENKEEIISDEEEGTEEDESSSSLYKIYRDKEEIFECNISVQGAKLSSSQVRLVFDHEICNLVFYGKISKDGKCAVPLKKMSFYPEKSTGRVRLEVIVDDTIFIPWEETFIVEGAKKVTVQIKSQKKVDFRF
jgi:hypothetical protein